MRLRKLAAVSTLALTAAGLTAVAPTANAVSPTVNLTCNALGSDFTFTGVFDTNLPTSTTYGKKSAYKLSATLTIPQDLSSLAASVLEAKYAQGDATFKVGGVDLKVALAKTPVDGSKPLALPISGNGSFAANKVGAHKIVVGNGVANVKFVKADGSVLPLDNIACTQAGALADTITVAKASTKSVAKVATKGGKGKATITVKGQNGTKATGKVAIKIGKKSFAGKVKNGKATIKVKGLKKGKNKVVVNYKGDANHKPSKKTSTVKVK